MSDDLVIDEVSVFTAKEFDAIAERRAQVNASRSAAMKRLWATPEFKAKMSAGHAGAADQYKFRSAARARDRAEAAEREKRSKGRK